MQFILFLILFPLLPAIIMLFTRHGGLRNTIVITSVVILAIPAVYLLVAGNQAQAPSLAPLVSTINHILLFSEIAIAVVL